MTSTATLYLVRHGRPPLNAAGQLRGRVDTPLDAIGRHEARALGLAFADVAVSAITSSPLRRARDTAAAIAATTGVDVDIDPELVDRDYGPWAGRPQAAVEAEFGSLDAAPSVEDTATFTQRVVAALHRAVHRAGNAPVIVVAHDAVNRHALAALVPDLGDPDSIPHRTGCWNRLDRRHGTWSAPVVDAVPGDGHRPSPPRATDPGREEPR